MRQYDSVFEYHKDFIKVWANVSVEEIKGIEGIDSVYAVDNHFIVTLDPRYCEDAVLACVSELSAKNILLAEKEVE